MSSGFSPVLRPKNEVELVFATALLDALAIPFFVHNRFFGAFYAVPRIGPYNGRTLFVPDDYHATASEALAGIPGRGAYLRSRIAPCDRPRVLAEFMLFGWFVPGAAVRVRPLRALAISLVAAPALLIVLVGLLSVLGLVASWADGLDAGRAGGGAAG
jgi:hypothetical protein